MNAHVHPPAVRTTCPYCGVGCGILATPDGQGGATIAGDPDHPANFGRLCSKGAALGETLGLETRLLHPMLRRDATAALARTDWDTALDQVADGFKRIIERDGPDAVAFYLSGQLLTEDYYVANKLMKGFIGSANVDTNSRLCMASSVAGHRRAFGADTVPGTLRGSRPGRSDRAGRLECRVVSPGAVPAHAGEPARARRQARRDRSAPHRDRRRGRPVSRDRARHGHRAVLRAAGPSREQCSLRSALTSTQHTAGFDRCAGERARDRARSCRTSRDAPACSQPTFAASSSCSPPRRASSPATRRA